jgi:CRP-like cAMP-binding protein
LEEKTNTRLSSEFQENLNVLRETYFFSALPLDVLKVLTYLCTRETFKPGEPLFSRDDDDGQAFYIVSGKVQLTYSGGSGEKIVREFDPDAFIGGLALMGTMRRLFTLQAVTDTTCLVLTREKFLKAMAQFPDQMPKIFKALVERIGNWEERFLAEIDTNCKACRKKIGVSLI